MKRKLTIALLTVAVSLSTCFSVYPVPAQAAVIIGTSAKKQNLLSNSQCIVYEPHYNADDSQNLTPGTTFSKDPYIRSSAKYDAYCFVRVEIPTANFTLDDGSSVVTDTVKMLYNEKEGINTSEWKTVKEIPSSVSGTNSVYIFEYVGNSSVLKARTKTGILFDSMRMPNTVSDSKVSSVEDFTGSVTVQGYVVSTASASNIDDAYSKIQQRIETDGSYSSNSAMYDNEQQGTIDTLTKEKLELQGQVDNLEERLNTKLSTGNAKANEVISGKIFSTSYAIDLVGTMPNYDRGLFVANSDGTYSWTDLDGITHTQTKEGYLATYPAEAGIVRNADGTITIKAGYHAEQVLDDANQSYTIRYNGNGGTGSMADQKIANDTGTKLTKNAYARTGYTFTGWNTEADGTGTGYTDQEAISHSGIHDLILYAQWEPITYYVAFNGNGNTYGSMSVQKFTYDEAQPLTENYFEKDSYELSGWSTSPNGAVQFKNMEAVSNLTSQADATITLYAVWAATGNAADNHIDNTSHTHVWVTKYDSQRHWEECSVCGQTRNVQNHSFTETSILQDPSVPCRFTNQYFRTCSCGYSEGYKKYPCTPNGTWIPTNAARHVHYQYCTKCGAWTGSSYCIDANGQYLSCKNPGTCVVCGQVVTANDHHIDGGVCNWCGTRFYDITLKSITYSNNDRVTVVFNGHTYNGFEWTSTLWPNATAAGYSCYSSCRSSYQKLNANTYEFTIDFTLDHNKARRVDLNWISDDENCTVNGHTVYESYIPLYGYHIQSDLQAPNNISVAQTPQRTSNGWTTAMQFTVSGNDYGGSQNVTIQLIDSNSNVLYSGVALVNNNAFSYTFTPNIEAYGSQNFTVRVTDNCYNSTDKTITVSNVDSKAPVMMNSVNYFGQWAKSRTFTVQASDSGAGNVKIGINRLSDMTAGSKNGTTYTKTYCFAGDKYDEETWLVFMQDAAGNLNQVQINIGKLDNTAPSVTATVSGNIATVNYSDYNTTLKREGSGVTKIGICNSKDKTVAWQNASNNKIELPKSGVYYIYAQDAAGNLSRPYTIYY